MSSRSFWDDVDNPAFGIDDAFPLLSQSATVLHEREKGKKRARNSVQTKSEPVKRKARRVPQVLSAKETLASKYPQEIKARIASCLDGKLEFDIHDQVRGAVRRPALLLLSSYWFYSWGFLRAFVKRWPSICLPRTVALLRQLSDAQRLFFDQFPQMMHENEIEKQQREQYRMATSTTTSVPRFSSFQEPRFPQKVEEGKGVSRVPENEGDEVTTILAVGATLSRSSLTIRHAARERAMQKEAESRRLFLEGCAESRVQFTVDKEIEAHLEQDTIHSDDDDAANAAMLGAFADEGQWDKQQASLVRYRQAMFECFAMFILAVAERGGDIFLKRSSVNGYISELVRAKEAFERKRCIAASQVVDFTKASVYMYSPEDERVGNRYANLTNGFVGARVAISIDQRDVRIAHRHISAVFDLFEARKAEKEEKK